MDRAKRLRRKWDRETPGWIKKMHIAVQLTLYLLCIAQIQSVLNSLQALYLTTAWRYALGSPHNAASISLVLTH